MPCCSALIVTSTLIFMYEIVLSKLRWWWYIQLNCLAWGKCYIYLFVSYITHVTSYQRTVCAVCNSCVLRKIVFHFILFTLGFVIGRIKGSQNSGFSMLLNHYTLQLTHHDLTAKSHLTVNDVEKKKFIVKVQVPMSEYLPFVPYR